MRRKRIPHATVTKRRTVKRAKSIGGGKKIDPTTR